jgi:hypothetical protein
MKNTIIFLFLLTIYSCNNDEEYKPKKSKNIPSALSVDVGSLKRKDTDLIENLYKEISAKDASLKKLEIEIDKLETGKDDSLKAFADYDKNNIDYYRTFEKHLKDIQDSVLRKRMKKILDSSLVHYKSKLNSQRKVFDSTNTLYTSLSDLHWVLKLSRTLAVMETYQDNNIPDTTRLKNTIEKLNNTLKVTDSLLKQEQQQKPNAE